MKISEFELLRWGSRQLKIISGTVVFTCLSSFPISGSDGGWWMNEASIVYRR